ncbi:MAG: anhydro-N-acetylmuramic acid kinase [Planctomycetota bacterium]
MRIVIGCMTGTSLDGLDAASVRIEGDGLSMRASLLGIASRPLEIDGLAALARGDVIDAATVARIAMDFGELHADTIATLISAHGTPTFVTAHGQTVFHAPPRSWQLINPWPIAHRHRCPVLTDLRGADLSAAGQGAPITPLADWIMFRDETASRAVVNLGGFCNVTLLDAGSTPERIRGFDVCACNQLLDAIARQTLGTPYDEGGAAAVGGTVDQAALASLLPLLRHDTGRSLGTGDEALAWLAEQSLSGPDLAATACEAIGSRVGEAVGAADEVLLTGGGARNAALVRRIEAACTGTVVSIDRLGVPLEARESMAMAVLGALIADGVHPTLPGVTGANEPIPLAGSWINVTPNL